jgi:hypothetical protein
MALPFLSATEIAPMFNQLEKLDNHQTSKFYPVYFQKMD